MFWWVGVIFLDRSAKSVHAELQKARSKWNPVAYKTHFICWVMVCGDLRVNCEDVKATCGAFEAEVSLTSLPELTAISNIYPPCCEKKKKKVAHYAKFDISTALHFSKRKLETENFTQGTFRWNCTIYPGANTWLSPWCNRHNNIMPVETHLVPLSEILQTCGAGLVLYLFYFTFILSVSVVGIYISLPERPGQGSSHTKAQHGQTQHVKL